MPDTTLKLITLKIIKPKHDQVFVFSKPDQAFIGVAGKPPKPQALAFQGSVTLPAELKKVTLYYRWYSSLNTEAGKDEQFSLNPLALSSAKQVYVPAKMAMGTHVITFAASDRAEEKREDVQAMRYGGVTGGADSPDCCVIHLFKASILEPAEGVSVPKNSLLLKAEAPSAWSDKNYHRHNRLVYRWLLAPVGDHVRPTISIEQSSFEFDAESVPVALIHRPTLPDTAVGAYQVGLNVEYKSGPNGETDPTVGLAQDSRQITLTG